MNTPTPGPWRVTECSGLHDFMVVGREWSIAELCGERETAAANATLIAAAPELLDACRAFCGDFESNGLVPAALSVAYHHALHIIAKAEGR